MKHYPSIRSDIDRDIEVHVFDKLDGSNIRAEWSKKRGEFYKFGSRQQLLDPNDPTLGPAVRLVNEKYGMELFKRFSVRGYESVVCFFEFHGPSSFAGMHQIDEPHDVTLIDIAPYKHGLLPPEAFLELAQGLDFARLLHVGQLTPELEERIRSSDMPGMTLEGVVCKYDDFVGQRMFKVKSREWLRRLREKCGDDENLFRKLM